MCAMHESTHRLCFADSSDLSFVADQSVGLVVTSPPYPMIEMWDKLFSKRTPAVEDALCSRDGRAAFELMHSDLDRIWAEVFRVVISGGFACINIGDATRKVGDRFQLYSNHSRPLCRWAALERISSTDSAPKRLRTAVHAWP